MRQVLERDEYRKLKERRWAEQQGRCLLCGDPMRLDGCELHHRRGRGIGGGFRDDADTELICRKCHQKEERKKKPSKFGG